MLRPCEHGTYSRADVAHCRLLICSIQPTVSHMALTRYAIQFGKLLRKKREWRRISQEELADIAGLHRTHISLIETGLRSVRVETIERLAKALKVQPGTLMPPIRLRKR